MRAGVFMRMSALVPVPVMTSGVLGILALGLVGLGGCGQQPLPPPPPPPPKPAGLWTPADTQSVAKDLCDSALHQQWLIAFHTHNQHLPKLAVTAFDAHATSGGDAAAAALVAVVNDDLPADATALVGQLCDDFTASTQVEIVTDPATADFIISGVLSRELVPGGARYPVDVHLSTPAGETLWTSGLEHTIIAPDPAAAPPATAPTAPTEAPAGK